MLAFKPLAPRRRGVPGRRLVPALLVVWLLSGSLLGSGA